MEIFSERLRLLRKEHHLKQDEAAQGAGLNARTYRRYEEEADRDPPASAVVALARFYGASADYLLGLTDEH